MATEKDSRTYIRVHDGMPDHPKVDALSDGAFRLLIWGWCYCSRYLTDGRIPDKVWSRKGNGRYRNELHNAGLTEKDESTAEVIFHDYLDHQRSAAEVADLRKHRQEAGRLGGKAKAKGLAKGLASATANGVANGKQNLPIDIDIDIAKGKNTAAPDVFAEFWAAYPRKTDKGNARKAWDKALKKTDARVVIAAAAAYAATNPDPKFTAHPTTWLNGERWDDEQALPLLERPKTYWTPEAPPREVADNPAAYSAWYAEQAAKKRATS